MTVPTDLFLVALAVTKAHPFLRGQSRYQPADRTDQFRGNVEICQSGHGRPLGNWRMGGS